MYLSRLLINVGDNPDRPRPGRLWLRNLYHVHQRLCMAFPSATRKERDPNFLAPYAPDDFPEQRHLADKNRTEVAPAILKQVHSRRSPESGFLFRIDPLPGGQVIILIQSAAKPDWEYAFHNAGYLLAAPPQVKSFDLFFAKGQLLRFRVRANLSKKIKRSTDGVDLKKAREGTDRMGRVKEQSKRVALTWRKGQNLQEVIREWFGAKGDQGGFQVETFHVLKIGWDAGNRPNSRATGHKSDSASHRMKFRSALFEGTLTVTDAAKFQETMVRGIGHGKAFGFGLLSVAPVRGDV